VAAKFETDHERGGVVSDPSGSGSETVLTQLVNVGIEVLSAVVSFLSCEAFKIHSELPGGEKVGRTSFSQAITSIFDGHDLAHVPAEDGTSPSTAGGSSRPRPE